MIEEIQALMPILEKISDGALWAFGIYMAAKVISIIIWPIAFCVVVLRGIPLLRPFLIGGEGFRDHDLYRVNVKGAPAVKYIGDIKAVRDLFEQMQDGSEYVHGSDVKRAIKLLKAGGAA